MVLICWASARLEGNGGAWQVGVPSTGNAAATDKKHSTNVSIEDESLTIDLHQEFAAIEVRYRMKNSGPKAAQDFFFSVERWAPEESEADNEGGKPADLEDYRVTADGAELKWKTVDVPKPEKPSPAPTAEASAATEAASPNKESTNDEVATPEEVEIARPKERFQKIRETRYEWEFRDLEPTLADDLKITAHRAYDNNPVSYGNYAEDVWPARIT
ncbi:MAG: hypothetical protein M3Y03_05565 [Verrucomicrobiota bacterium]|nr:hypothetical protein [Verrucomicrobiota bacterium]